jgi:hypothetical protein
MHRQEEAFAKQKDKVGKDLAFELMLYGCA